MTIDISLIDYDSSSMDEQVITALEYEEATRTVVRTLGQAAGVEVVFAGDKAMVGKEKKSGKRIVHLPANNPEAKMTRKQYFIGQGFANHETLHNLCTDIDGLDSRMKKLEKHKQNLTLALAQGIEDVRIENAGQLLYPGIPRKIDATAQYAAQAFLDMPAEERDHIVTDFKMVGPLAITWAGRKKLGYNAPALDQCLDMLPADIRAKAEKYADLVLKLPTGAKGAGDIDREESFKGSHQAVDLAAWIAKEELQDPDEEPEDDDEDGDEEGEGEGEGEEGEGHGDPVSWGAGMDGSEDISQAHLNPLDPDFLNQVKHHLNTKLDPRKYRHLTTALDVYVRVGDNTKIAKELFPMSNLKSYAKTVDESRGKLPIMKSKLERALMTAMDTEYVSGHRTGRLDIRGKGVAIMSGRENIFRRKEGGKDISTAVTILIDASGSMSGTKIHLAQKTAIVLAEAIGRVGVPIEVLVFNNRSPNRDEVPNYDEVMALRNDILQANRGENSYGRIEPLSMYVAKSFEDNMNASKVGLGGIHHMAGHNNSDGEALLRAWEGLRKRPEKNKVMLVLSDGAPCCAGNGTVAQHLRDTTELLTKEGANLIGLGILDNSVKYYYKKHAVINNLDELAGTALDNIARALLGERFVVDHGQLMKVNDVKGARV